MGVRFGLASFVRVVFLSCAGYGLVFVAARAWLPREHWERGRTPLGVAADHLKGHFWGAVSWVRDESKPVE